MDGVALESSPEQSGNQANGETANPAGESVKSHESEVACRTQKPPSEVGKAENNSEDVDPPNREHAVTTEQDYGTDSSVAGSTLVQEGASTQEHVETKDGNSQLRRRVSARATKGKSAKKMTVPEMRAELKDKDWSPKVGEVIWAKLPRYPWWPGQVVERSQIPMFASGNPDGWTVVHFFGTLEYGDCQTVELVPFEMGLEPFGSKSSAKVFRTAVSQGKQYLETKEEPAGWDYIPPLPTEAEVQALQSKPGRKRKKPVETEEEKKRRYRRSVMRRLALISPESP